MIVLKNLIIPPEDAPADETLIDLKTGNPKEEQGNTFRMTKIYLTGIRFAFRSHLIHLMCAIIRWRLQPQKRTRRLLVQIISTRIELDMLKEERNIIHKKYILSIWDKCFYEGKKLASAETGIRNINFPILSISDVFEAEFYYQKEV